MNTMRLENQSHEEVFSAMFDDCPVPTAVFDISSLRLIYKNHRFSQLPASVSGSLYLRDISSFSQAENQFAHFYDALEKHGKAVSEPFAFGNGSCDVVHHVFSAYTAESSGFIVVQCIECPQDASLPENRFVRFPAFDELIDTLPYCIAIYDYDGCFLKGNNSFSLLFEENALFESHNLFQDEFLGRYPAEMTRVKSGHAACLPVVNFHDPDSVPDSGEEDKQLSLSVSLFPLVDGNGGPEAIMALYEDIDTRKNYERHIRKSRESEKAVFDSVPISIWKYDFSKAMKYKKEIEKSGVTDIDRYFSDNRKVLEKIILSLRIVDVNREAMVLYGAKSRDEMIGAMGTYITDEIINTYIKIFKAYLAGEKTIECETKNRTLDGRIIDILVRVTFPDRQSTTNVAMSAVTDITELKRIEKAYRESEERYRMMFNAVPVAVFKYDFSASVDYWRTIGFSGSQEELEEFFNTRQDVFSQVLRKIQLISINDEALRLYRAESREKFIAEFGSHHTPESILVFKRAVISFLTGVKSFTTETVNEAFDGVRLHLLYRITFPSDGPLECRALVSVVDITKRKKVEQELADALKRFRIMADYSPYPISVQSSSGDYLYINQRYTEYFGYTLDTIPRDDEFLCLTMDDAHADLPDNNDNRTFAITCNNGDTCEVILHTVTFDDGREYRTYEDVTERKRMEDERLKVSKLDSLGILAGGIAHDFNNIITAVMGNISLAKRFTGSNDKAFRLLDKSESACNRAKDLTQQLLAFSRGGAPVRETSSIGDIIKDSAIFSLIGSNVRCEFDIPDSLHPVRVDKGQFSQVINNIIINADQSMPEGGKIMVSARNTVLLGEDSAACVEITIRDAGVGIPPDIIPKIFDPYFTTKESGRGLGLASAYAIVKRHDGSINITSQPGKGTTVVILLPAEKDRGVENMVDSKRDMPEETKGLSVLVMDDEPEIRSLLKDMLEFSGHSFTGAADGGEAIALYKDALDNKRPYDVVIMDLTVPGGLGGKETIKELLKIDSDVTAIVSSGYSNDPVLSEYKKYGFKAVMSKPYRLREITTLLSRLANE